MAGPGALGRRRGPGPGAERRRRRPGPGRRAAAPAGRVAGSREGDSPWWQRRRECDTVAARARRPPGAETTGGSRQPLRTARRGAPAEEEACVRGPMRSRKVTSQPARSPPARGCPAAVHRRVPRGHSGPRLETNHGSPPPSPGCPRSPAVPYLRDFVGAGGRRFGRSSSQAPRCPLPSVPGTRDYSPWRSMCAPTWGG